MAGWCEGGREEGALCEIQESSSSTSPQTKAPVLGNRETHRESRPWCVQSVSGTLFLPTKKL
jgi:hypothetical protein